MSKVRVTPELIEKAKKVFADAKEKKKETIKAGEGLSRTELRALKRAGIVESLPVFARRKYTDTVPTTSYVWRLK